MELVAEELRATLRSNGIRLDKDGLSLKSALISLIPVLILVESTLSLAYRWEDLNRRFLALEDANIWFTISVLTFGVVCFTDNVKIILLILTEPYSMYGIVDSAAKRSVVTERVHSTETKIKYMNKLVDLIRFNFFAVPFFQTVLKLMDGGRTVFDLYLPYEAYHIRLVKSLYLFFLINVCQIACSFIFANGSKTVFLSFIGPIQRVILDIRLLCVSIKELDDYVTDETHPGGQYFKLKHYMSNMIRHHGRVCSRISLINKAIPLFAFFGLQSCCSQMCLQFYWIAEVDDTALLQAKDLIQVLAVGGYLYFYSSVGQDIINESEILRTTISQCTWIDRPLWFKKSLLVMMTAADKTFELRPYGLYTISFDSFTSMIKAAYSFFNLLRTFRK